MAKKMAEKVRKTAVKKPAVKKEIRKRTSRPVPIAKRTDWPKMQIAVMDLILRLQQQPQKTPFDLEQWKSPAQLKIALFNYCSGRINVEQFTLIVKKIFQPPHIEGRTDWEEMVIEVQSLIDRLNHKPNRKAPRINKPGIVIDAYTSGDVEYGQAIILIKEWAGLPIEEQNSINRLRQQVLAIIARMQQLSENRCDCRCLSSEDIITAFLKGMLTREQALTKLDKLTHPED